MRKKLGILFGLLFLAGCGDTPATSIQEDPEGSGTAGPGSPPIFDAILDTESINSHFFFLPPLASGNPEYAGVAVDDQRPVVTLCPIEDWDSETEGCQPALVEFSVDASNPDERVFLNPGSHYHAVWNPEDQSALTDQVYRIAVSLAGRLLGRTDILTYRGTPNYWYGGADLGRLSVSNDGSLTIGFRIEEGALEEEFCDPEGVEDCDVEIYSYESGGCLRVFGNPGMGNEVLGSQACVPSHAAMLDGEQVEGTYAVILTLEEDGTFQGTGDTQWQVPFFPDLRTEPAGISFDESSNGIEVVVCQASFQDGALEDDLHPFLRPFAIFSDGFIYLPEEFTYGTSACEGFGQGSFGEHGHATASGSNVPESAGLLQRMAGALVSFPRLFLPQPLRAFRLHGGLNTTVYDTRGDDLRERRGDGGGERPPDDGFESASPSSQVQGEEEETFVVEMGALLDVSPEKSTALAIPNAGRVGSPTTIHIEARDFNDGLFPLELPVEVEVTGANPQTLAATWQGSGHYEAVYQPEIPGSDSYAVSIEGKPISPISPSEISPRGPDPSSSTLEIGYSEVGSSTTVTVSVMDGGQNPYVFGASWPIDVVVSVSGANQIGGLEAIDDDGNGQFDGIYTTSYTPQNHGTDLVEVSINGSPAGEGVGITTAPRPADPHQTTLTASEGLVGSPTTVSVTVRNTAGEIYDYGDIRPASVEVFVSGGQNAGSFSAIDEAGSGFLDGVFTGVYTPSVAGTDILTASVNGVAAPGSVQSTVAPLNGEIIVDVDINGLASDTGRPVPENGITVILFQGEPGTAIASAVTDEYGRVAFPEVGFGSYTIHLPERDFDVRFPSGMTKSIQHNQAASAVDFHGETETLPRPIRVFRLSSQGGNGNAYEFARGTTSWDGARDQTENGAHVLFGVSGHMVTIADRFENMFLSDFFRTAPNLCPNQTNPENCGFTSWIGLFQPVPGGAFQWLTGEPVGFLGWPGWGEDPPGPIQPPNGPGDRAASALIDLTGTWAFLNGAGATTEGFFVEFEVERFPTPGL